MAVEVIKPSELVLDDAEIVVVDAEIVVVDPEIVVGNAVIVMVDSEIAVELIVVDPSGCEVVKLPLSEQLEVVVVIEVVLQGVVIMKAGSRLNGTAEEMVQSRTNVKRVDRSSILPERDSKNCCMRRKRCIERRTGRQNE